jgi:hypothetical protein
LTLTLFQLGSAIIPYITSPWATYLVLLVIISVHLAINYVAVKGLAIRSPNRQRAAIAWLWFRSQGGTPPSPQAVAGHELIFERPEIIRDPVTGRVIGKCHVGTTPLDVMRGSVLSKDYLDIFLADKYIVCFDPKTPLAANGIGNLPTVHVCLKEGFTRIDELKGWIHAVEICRSLALSQGPNGKGSETSELKYIRSTFQDVKDKYDRFVGRMKEAGWNFDESHLASGSGPKVVLSTIAQTSSIDIPT